MRKAERILADSEVEEVAKKILAARFGAFGFKSVDVAEDEDLEGAAILRMIAQVESSVPARQLIDALDAVRTELLKKGEDRFIFLSTNTPESNAETDEEE